jgi:hypothetical protein
MNLFYLLCRLTSSNFIFHAYWRLSRRPHARQAFYHHLTHTTSHFFEGVTICLFGLAFIFETEYH